MYRYKRYTLFRAAITGAIGMALLLGPIKNSRSAEPAPAPTGVLQCAFVCVAGVYNSELMAPYDVLEHTRYRDPDNFVRPFVASPDGAPFVTSEGITITPHYSFATAPPAQIVVIPSTETSMSDDLDNADYMAYVRNAVEHAQWVITVCDGAFPLAATGALDGRIATTFPGDRDALAERHPDIDVQYDVRIVVDGKFITSVGGGMSYEPAFWLVEHLYGKDHATRSAGGLVWDWRIETVPIRVR